MQNSRWNPAIFDSAGDRCYCADCFPSSWINSQSVGGETYIIPRGWVRFGLKTPKMFVLLNDVWNTWCNAFHGTSNDCAFSIFLHKTLLIHGDLTRDGNRIGRISSSKEHNLYFVSPHICYASHPWYSKINNAGTKNGKKRYSQMVLAMKIRPGSYQKKSETEGKAKLEFDDYSIIPEDQIEWYSSKRGCVMPYGLLVRVFGKTKKRDIERCSYKN